MFSCKYYEVFEDSYFEEHLQTTASVLNGFFRIAILEKLFFRTVYLSIYFYNFCITFASLDIFISLNNFITYRDSHAK